MQSSLVFYGRFFSLLAVLATMVGYNFARWGLRRHPSRPVMSVPDGQPDRAPELFETYGCVTCHIIPGIPKASGTVGPRLDRLEYRIYLAGSLPNSPENLIRFPSAPFAPPRARRRGGRSGC